MRKAITPTNSITRRDLLGGAVGMLAAPWLRPAGAKGQLVPEPAERQKIEAAIPAKAFSEPRKARKLLIFDLNVGYGGHRSITTCNLAFTLMGEKTDAFQTVISRDPSVFKGENLRQFDAVFLNNTVGNLFEDPALRQSLIEFVYGGGGLMGVHGTSVAFTKWPGAIEDWPEFGVMLGARGANHRASDEHVFIKLDDAAHPVNQAFAGQGFDYRDELFRVHEPYSRNRVRVLFSIDTEKTDLQQGPAYGKIERPDNDYALAWVRQYGRGRVFYCTIAHNPYVFWDPKMLQFYLAAAQFVLGDLPAPTTASGKLTPAILAQEQLGWRLGLTPPTSEIAAGSFTLFEAIDKAAELGLLYVGGSSRQTVSHEIPKNLDGQLNSDELRQVRLKLDAAGVRLPAYSIGPVPSDEAGCRSLFQFGKKMGIEAFIGEPPGEALDTIERFCDEYDINLAISSGGQISSQNGGQPQEVLKLCNGRSKRIGVCAPATAETVAMLRDRLLILQVHDLNELTGISAGKIAPLLEEIYRLGVKPTMFSVEYMPQKSGSMPGIAQGIDLFNKVSIQLVK
jgi:type 1 glutamine amidotransferase